MVPPILNIDSSFSELHCKLLFLFLSLYGADWPALL